MPHEATLAELASEPWESNKPFGRRMFRSCEMPSHANLRITLSGGRIQCLGCRRIFYASTVRKEQPVNIVFSWEEEVGE